MHSYRRRRSVLGVFRKDDFSRPIRPNFVPKQVRCRGKTSLWRCLQAWYCGRSTSCHHLAADSQIVWTSFTSAPIPHCAYVDMRLYSLTLCLLPLFTQSASVDQLVLSGQNMPETAETPIAKSTLSDLLTIEHSASIFFSYARETQLSQLFQDKDAGTTLLVPTNKAVMALARKP